MQILKNLKNILIRDDISLRDALIHLDKNGIQILLLENSNKKLTGVLTDGDIRRYILKDGSIDVPVDTISNTDFYHISEAEINDLNKTIEKYQINHLPIINKEGQAKSLAIKAEIKQSIKLPVVIVAGGKGSRLSPLTNIIPKPLMPVGNTTMLEKIMENFYNQGFNNFKVIINYKKELIKTYIKEIDHPYKIDFIDEKQFGGTAGGLALLANDLKGPFIVTNCDILGEFRYSSLVDWHNQRKADLTILGVRKRIDIPYGVVKVDTESYVTEIKEKPFYNNMIVSGIYVLNPSVLDLIPKTKVFGMDQLINKMLSEKMKITCYPIESGWHDIGQFEEYKKLLNV